MESSWEGYRNHEGVRYAGDGEILTARAVGGSWEFKYRFDYSNCGVVDCHYLYTRGEIGNHNFYKYLMHCGEYGFIDNLYMRNDKSVSAIRDPRSMIRYTRRPASNARWAPFERWMIEHHPKRIVVDKTFVNRNSGSRIVMGMIQTGGRVR